MKLLNDEAGPCLRLGLAGCALVARPPSPLSRGCDMLGRVLCVAMRAGGVVWVCGARMWVRVHVLVGVTLDLSCRFALASPSALGGRGKAGIFS